jgi:hypothetical protein
MTKISVDVHSKTYDGKHGNNSDDYNKDNTGVCGGDVSGVGGLVGDDGGLSCGTKAVMAAIKRTDI